MGEHVCVGVCVSALCFVGICRHCVAGAVQMAVFVNNVRVIDAVRAAEVRVAQ